jgi:hypothetical protein
LKTYPIGGRVHAITPLSLVLGGLIVLFALLESLAGRRTLERRPALDSIRRCTVGVLRRSVGASRRAARCVSGALRAWIATRFSVPASYAPCWSMCHACWSTAGRRSAIRSDLAGSEGRGLIVAATLAAFLGSYLGTRWVRKVTLRVLQRCVGVGLLLLGVAIGAGLV